MATVTMIVVTGEDVVDEDLVHSCSTRALDGPVRMVTEPVVDRASPGASSPATAGSGLRQTIVTVSPQSPSRCFFLRTAPPGAWSSCLYMPRGRGGGVGRAELTWGGGSAPAARSSTTPFRSANCGCLALPSASQQLGARGGGSADHPGREGHRGRGRGQRTRAPRRGRRLPQTAPARPRQSCPSGSQRRRSGCAARRFAPRPLYTLQAGHKP